MGSQFSTGIIHDEIRKHFELDNDMLAKLESKHKQFVSQSAKEGTDAFFINQKQFQLLFEFSKLTATKIFSLLDTEKRRKIVTSDLFGGLYLLSKTAHIKEKVGFLFKLADIHDNGTINKEEVIMIMHSVCRGLARMKGIQYPSMDKIEDVMNSYFKKNYHLNESRISLEDSLNFCKHDTRVNSFLSNLDAAALADLCGLYKKQAKLLRELFTIDHRLDELEGFLP